MKIELRFFASIREALGVSQESLTVPESIRTVGELREMLCQRSERWAQALSESHSLRMACNQQMSEADTRIDDGCEVAFFPPVTGG